MFPELEVLVPPLEKIISKKKKSAEGEGAPLGPEAERALEVVKAALRVVSIVNSAPDVKTNRSWTEFVGRISSVPGTVEMLDAMNVEDDHKH